MIEPQVFNRLLNRKAPDRFTGGYFGVRNANFFTGEFLKYVHRCESFLDLTAGTGQFPYSLVKAEFPRVGVNDRCYYSSLILNCLFNKGVVDTSTPLLEWAEDWRQKIAPENLRLRPGYLSRHFPVREGERIFHPETSQYIDTLCRRYSHNPLVLYAVGKSLQRWSFRSHNWSRTDTKKQWNRKLRADVAHPWVLGEMIHLRKYISQMPSASETMATYMDAGEAAATHNVQNGFVYIDPAWPWSKAIGSKNPYNFFTHEISGILKQKRIKDLSPWERDWSTDRIMGLVAGWMDTAFDNGAKYFCVCTQDTNYPPPEAEVYPWLDQRYKRVKLLIIDDWSQAAGRKYLNYWGIYKR